jgi:hypothetical protein
VANALAEFAAEWADSTATWSTGTGEHLVDANGDLRGDIANPRERAALLFADLAEAAAEEAAENEEEYDESYMDEADYGVDAIDAYEDALEGRYS